MAFKTIEEIDVNGKCVLMRADFNVPMSANNTVSDSFRITQALPTIRSILSRGGRLVIMSHLGRPDGSGYVENYSLKPVADQLARLLGDDAADGVFFPSTDCTDEVARAAVADLKDGQVMLLENLRFHVGEMEDDANFAGKLAELLVSLK